MHTMYVCILIRIYMYILHEYHVHDIPNIKKRNHRRYGPDTCDVTVVGSNHAELQRLQAQLTTKTTTPSFRARALDIAALGDAELVELVGETADVVLSLLPAPLHPRVARACLAAGRHLVTSSYVSEEVKGMDAEAKARGVVLLNEAGLDPGCVRRGRLVCGGVYVCA